MGSGEWFRAVHCGRRPHPVGWHAHGFGKHKVQAEPSRLFVQVRRGHMRECINCGKSIDEEEWAVVERVGAEEAGMGTFCSETCVGAYRDRLFEPLEG